MDLDSLEKILSLFDNLQIKRKPLKLNIDEDLSKILPLPKKLILDMLTDDKMPNFFYLSDDQNTIYFQNNVTKIFLKIK